MTKSNSRIVTIEVTEPSEVELRASEAREKYLGQFLSPHEVNSSRKAYLYPEVHAVLSRMVKNLGVKGVSIGSYASEILLDHFAHHQSVMQSVFDSNNENLFQ